jgi:uncharacterized protein (TIGR02246 family)
MSIASVENTEIAALSAVPEQVIAAWAKHDAKAFASVFTEDGTMILPQSFSKGRAEIEAFMAAAFEGEYKDTRVTGQPVHVRFLGDDVAVMISRGGVLQPGEKAITDDTGVLATWLLHRRDGQWKLAAYQNTPTGA